MVSSVTRVRRSYNKWVANETLEDFALRFTARRARKWPASRVANTAIGSISFLALEAIGAALTLSYGQSNATAAILIAGAILFLTGLPISYHAARAGVDIDLLTRGAGFGYLGSTITSLIYASFTFIFFALEAAILAQALNHFLGIPLAMGYLLNALLVIPLVTHGFTRIGAFQTWTQPFWILLQIAPFIALLLVGTELGPWLGYEGRSDGLSLVSIAAATGIALALIAQIGEQVDFLRFLPEPKSPGERRAWWAALLAAGPGWAVIGTLKMLAGSFLAVMVLEAGGSPFAAVEPTQMYLAAFQALAPGQIAVVLTGAFVILAQLKINVTNAYAGSIAWSNFFARLTHSHPGRVVWLVFNVAIALVLMEFGVFGALETTLSLYSLVAVAWIGSVTADLVINLPLGLRPREIEFRRGYLFDINPVGTGAMALATVLSLIAAQGGFGETARAFASLIALLTALTAAPLIALATGGRYYLARPHNAAEMAGTCQICEHSFDPEDMVACPFHAAPICSLCCSLESRCEDACKPMARLDRQFENFATNHLPQRLRDLLISRYGSFALLAGLFTTILGATLAATYHGAVQAAPDAATEIGYAFSLAFALLAIVVGVVAWLFTLSNESRVLAHRERERHFANLQAEIRAHKRTDAELAQAKEVAEAANDAKSRYLVGITHELRTPLNAILGYAQLLESDPTIPAHRRPALKVMRRSSEHLADLIEGLLDISKIEAGRLDVYRDEVALRELLEQIAATFAPEAADKGLHFETAFEGIPEQVIADERRLRQILINLLSNAVRYTERGTVSFAVTHRNEIATIVVSDTGPGIRAEDHDRIFRPFQRIERPGLVTRGTGLGLTITRLLVEMLGGDIQLESEPGEGSLFRIRLFLPRDRAASKTAPVRRPFGYQGRRRQILVVDDNSVHRRFLADALRPLGFQVSFAENGETALSMVRLQAPDLALIDVAMPGMSGWTVSAEMRQTLGLTAPIMMVSAHAADAKLDGAVGIFHDEFLPKPVNIDLLLARIERLLKLNWIYDRPDATTCPQMWAPMPSLERLDVAISTGHMRAAETIVAEMRDDVRAVSFADHAQSLLEDVDLEGLSQLVAEVRDAG